MDEKLKLEGRMLNIIHFNDVYNITESNKEICGGAARFMTAINKLKQLKPEPLIFFSGDFLSPSNISTVTKGEHMISVMNSFGITCAMIGNHDLDYGNEHCIKILKQLNYPTLNTNIFTPKSSQQTSKTVLEPLGQCKTHFIMHHNGFKIGIIGVSEDWCNTIPIKPKNGIIYKDFIKECEHYINKLKQENDLNLMIVLTHSRKENDILLSNKVRGIDLILGGHDHLYCVESNEENKSLLVKSGCDFKGLSLIQLLQKNDKETMKIGKNQQILDELCNLCLFEQRSNINGLNYNFDTFHFQINRKLNADATMNEIVHNLSDDFLKNIQEPIGAINCDLDTRFSYIRRNESAACNLLCDIIRNAYKCDVVILCGGGVRSDKVHSKGIISYKDILDLSPFQDPIICKRMKGKYIIEAIKHSILNLPKLDGRFAHVSGLKYVYDSNKEPMKRLLDIKVNGYGEEEKGNPRFGEIEPDKFYTVASREYTMNGGDGFECLNLSEHTFVVDEERGVPLSVLLRNFFWAVSTVNDAIKLMNTEKDKQLKEDVGKLMKRLCVEELVKDENESGMLLKIEPVLEGRIIDKQNEKNGMQSTDAKVINGDKFILSPQQFNKLPNYTNMTHKPRRAKSIFEFVCNFEQENE